MKERPRHTETESHRDIERERESERERERVSAMKCFLGACRRVACPTADSSIVNGLTCFLLFCARICRRVLPCGHRFHPGCVDDWLKKQRGRFSEGYEVEL